MPGMDDRPRHQPHHGTGERHPVTPADDTPPAAPPREIGGPPGPEPTRHGDWEYNGRCTDF
jgi:hypothetical protein